MGNKLSCSCGPLIKKAYRYDETPFRPRREGRLWAEVFHVSAASGAVRWQQVSEDLVPVNIKCIQDDPQFVFKITAYNSQVEKILDVTLTQPGTRLGQASECFVYWKDIGTGDTWGLNFTSPLDAKQFRELCSPSFKFSRKASSSYSLRLNEPPSKKSSSNLTSGGKRKPQSTPSSPSRRATGGGGGDHRILSSDNRYGAPSATNPNEELQCTCMTAEALHRQRNGRVRYTASSTLPKAVLRQDSGGSSQSQARITAYPSTTSVNQQQQQQQLIHRQQQMQLQRQQQQQQQQQRQQQQVTSSGNSHKTTAAQYSRAAYAAQSVNRQKSESQSRSMDLSLHYQQQQQQQQMYQQQQQRQQQMQQAQQQQQQLTHAHSIASGYHPQQQRSTQAAAGASSADPKSRSKSSDDVRRTVGTGTEDLQLDSMTLKKMLHPLDSSATGGIRREGSQESSAGGGSRTSTTGTNTAGTTTTTITLGVDGRRTRVLGRPTSVPAWGASSGANSSFTSGDNTTATPTRSRIYRSETGRRRSLERSHCFDYTDLSPTSDPTLLQLQLLQSTSSTHHPNHYPSQPDIQSNQTQQQQLASSHQRGFTPVPSSSGDEQATARDKGPQAAATGGRSKSSASGRSASPTIKVLQEYEQHLRNALAKGNDADTYSLNTFETILSQSMENVVAFMREVQSEIEAIRREESHYRSSDLDGMGIPGVATGARIKPHWARSYTLPSRGASLPPPGLLGSSTSDLYHTLRKSSAPVLDTLSVDYGHLLRPQSSFESTASDSKAYLTSSEMSDDERLSLTTAISDDDDGETRDSPYRAKSGAAAAAFQCTGAVRKAGFLSVKKWLLRKQHQIQLARKRGWKGYWVCLKGTTLLFYPCDSRDGRAIESTPRHLIIIDGAIMQPIPEHPKRDFIFCLSTAFGDAYLFQAPCQVELENWIGAIHNACGAAFARHRGKTGALHLLQDEIQRLDRQVEVDAKLKHMAELQLSVVSDGDSRRALNEQIRAHDESLEQNHCEQFRLRCYMASIQSTELPNPKTLLAHVSKSTKLILNRLGVFTVSSFHAYICARSPSMLTNVISGRGNNSRRRSTGGIGVGSSTSRSGHLSSRSGSSSRSGVINRSFELTGDKLIKMSIPPDDENVASAYVKGSETVEELLWSVLIEKQLSPNDHFIRIQKTNGELHVPSRHDTIDNFPPYDKIEILPKILYQVELTRSSLEQLFGFSVEAELVENSVDHHNQDELCVYVSRVEDMSLASAQGLTRGDEIMVINGAIVSDLDMMYIESVLQEEASLCMMLRSCRTEAPEMAAAVRSTDEYIESLVCPPPPTDGAISDEMIGKLIVPSPHWSQDRPGSRAAARAAAASTLVPTLASATVSGEQIAQNLLKTAEEVTSEYCPRLSSHPTITQQTHRQMHQTPVISVGHHPISTQQIMPSHHHHAPHAIHQVHTTQLQIHPAPPGLNPALLIQHPGTPQPQLMHQASIDEESGLMYSRRPPLTDAEKLRKVMRELVDTEKTYVEHLNSLLEIYLEPMRKQKLLSNADICTLFGNIQEIVAFQRLFLSSLEEAVEREGSEFEKFEQPSQFRSTLFALGDSFLSHADKFKLYSSFCASHSKAQKILHPSNESLNPALADFLNSRSRQLKHLTDSGSDEHKHLAQALKGMERVAEHINEMQRIHEEYGAIFDHLQRQHYKSSRILIELSPVELLYYGGVDWVNIPEFLGKIKKGLDLHTMCFVFKQAVVFLCKERIRQKKKIVGTTNKLSEVEIIRYQVLIPVTEVQVRSISSGRDSQCSNDGMDSRPITPGLTSPLSAPISGEKISSGGQPASSSSSVSNAVASDEQQTASKTGGSVSQYIWELIHLRCTQIPGGTQRRTEKVYQLSNSTNEFRNAFLRTIRQIIRESVRNMAVPTTKPSIFQGKTLPHDPSAASSLSRQTRVMTSSSSQPQQSSQQQATSTAGQQQQQVTTVTITSSIKSSSQQAVGTSSTSGTTNSNMSTSAQTKEPSTDQIKGEKGKSKKAKPDPPPRDPKTTKSTSIFGSSSRSSDPSFPPPPSPLPSAQEEDDHQTTNNKNKSISHAHHTHSSKESCGACGADVQPDKGRSGGAAAASATPEKPTKEEKKSKKKK